MLSLASVTNILTIEPLVQWIHNTGPMMTYMAACEGTTCDKFDASKAQWFKIDEAGQKPGGSGWFQADLSKYISAGLAQDVDFPSFL